MALVEASHPELRCLGFAPGPEPDARRVHGHATEHEPTLNRLLDREPAPVAGVYCGGGVATRPALIVPT